MRKSLFAIAGAVLLTAAATPAQAVQITGDISFVGQASPIGGSNGWADATGVNFGTPTTVDTSSGDYSAATSGTPVTFTDFTFSPSLSPDPVSPLWTFNIGGTTYSFQLESLNPPIQGGNAAPPFQNSFLNLSGNGTLSITGFEDTRGTWEFEGTQAGFHFNFEASDLATPIPEPGSMLLLGTGLLGLGGAVRRRFSKKK